MDLVSTASLRSSPRDVPLQFETMDHALMAGFTHSMWYDTLTVIVLLLFAWRGASRGAIWQLAVVGSVVLCSALAGQFVPQIERHLPLQDPFRNWAAIGLLYLALSLVTFLLARYLRLKMEEKRFEEYDRHWGAILGIIKGIGLSLLVSSFAVALVPDARPAIRSSHSGQAARRALDLFGPMLPSKVTTGLQNAFDNETESKPETSLDIPFKLSL